MDKDKEIADLKDALRDLADAARSACDARRHSPLVEALFRADELLVRGSQWRKVLRGMDDHHAREARRHWDS